MTEELSPENFRGFKLANLRESYNLNQQELAELTNINKSTIWRYENNIIAPKYPILKRLSAYFKVETSYFYTD